MMLYLSPEIRKLSAVAKSEVSRMREKFNRSNVLHFTLAEGKEMGAEKSVGGGDDGGLVKRAKCMEHNGIYMRQHAAICLQHLSKHK